MKYFLSILGLFIALGQGVLAQNGDPAAAGGQRPNIIFILSDDHAYQAISAYGSQLALTPNIDRIAREGALFTRAMVTNSICGPSRASLLTGKYSHKNGFTLNEQKFNTDQPVFTDLLRSSGYQTAWIGKWHLGNLPRGLDYFRILNGQGDYYNPDLIGPADTVRAEGYVTDIITELAEKWLDGRDATKPFCLIVGEKATHREWVPDTTDLGAYDDKEFPMPSSFHDFYEGRVAAANQDMTIAKTLRLREDLKVHLDYDHDGNFDRLTPAQKKPLYNYYENKISKEFDSRHDTGEALLEWKYQRFLKDYLSVARSLDRNIGRLLDYLDEKGLTRNTVVIYASDQGFYLGEHGWFDKRWIYEESLRTPFVMRYPGVIRPGSQVSAITLNIDWGPTLLDIAGIKTPPDMQGVSFLPLVDGRGEAWRKAMYYHYYEYPQPHHVSPHFGIRTEHWMLVRFYGPGDFWELYDLDKDPEELDNLYGKPGYGAKEEELKAQLKELIRQYDDKDALKILEKGDGNSYGTVKIGRQEWMAANLNTTHFRNGDSIPEIEDAAQWQLAASQHRAAWCEYNGDSASGQKYHKLYNWYAVTDPRGLAPEGWHIPSIGEWAALTTFLGGDNTAGIKMKAADAWDGTNASGFEALPGGYRNHNGQFSHIHNIASWWSVSPADTTDAWTISLGYGNGVVSRSYDGMQAGLAVRCLRD